MVTNRIGEILSSRCSVCPRIASPVDQKVLAGEATGMFGAEKRAIGSELRRPAVASGWIGFRARAPKLVEALAGCGQHPVDVRPLCGAVEDPRQQIVDGDVAGHGLARKPGDEADETGARAV